MKRFLGLATVSLMLCLGVAAAQTGTVTGVVLDGEGLPVEEARVSLHQDGACLGYVYTGTDGAYVFEEVEVGVYTVRAGKPQVGSAYIEGIEVLEGETTVVPDLVLECGGGGSGGNQHQHKNQYKHQNQYSGGE